MADLDHCFHLNYWIVIKFVKVEQDWQVVLLLLYMLAWPQS